MARAERAIGARRPVPHIRHDSIVPPARITGGRDGISLKARKVARRRIGERNDDFGEFQVIRRCTDKERTLWGGLASPHTMGLAPGHDLSNRI
jgi:hypothetical protein